MQPIRYIISCFLLLATTALSAQLAASFNPASPVSGTAGQTITVDFVADQFDNVNSMQFPISFDSTIMRWVPPTIPVGQNTIQFGSLPNFRYANPSNPNVVGNIALANAGKITVSWDSPGFNPVTLDPGEPIFSLTFMFIASGQSPLYINPNTAPAIEVFANGSSSTPTFPQPPTNTNITGFAQIAGSDTTKTGRVVCVDIKGNDFDAIVGMQYTINWNPQVLQYRHTQAYSLNGSDCSIFNLYSPSQLTVAWSDPESAGVTLPDLTSQYEVCFNAIGANGSSSPVVIDGSAQSEVVPLGAFISVGGNETNVWQQASGVAGTIRIDNNQPEEIEMVNLVIDKDTVPGPGQTVDVAIKAKHYKHITSLLCGVQYDQNVITFNSVQGKAQGLGVLPMQTLMPTAAAEFNKNGAMQIQPGLLRIRWRDTLAQIQGESYNDNTTLLTLRFNVVGQLGTQSPITLVTVPQISPAPDSTAVRVSEKFCEYRPQVVAGSVTVHTTMVPLACSITNQTNVNCFGQNTGSVTATATGGSTTVYTYNWSGPGVTPANQNIQTLTNVPAGVYTVTVTSGAQTCTSQATITQPAAALTIPNTAQGIVINNIDCAGGSDGTITINPTGGTPTYTYVWTANANGQTGATISNLTAGNYTATVTDTKGCTFVSQAIPVTAPTQLPSVTVTTSTNVRCFGESNGSVQLNATGGTGSPANWQYAWAPITNPTQIVSNQRNPNNLPVGTYNVIATDQNGCTDNLGTPVQINGPQTALNVFATSTGVACVSENTGTITVAVDGGWGNYGIQWNPVPGAGGFSPTGVAAGTYTPTITDGGGCTAVYSPIVIGATQQAPSVVSSQINHISCHNAGDGSISLTLSIPAQVSWTLNGTPVGSGLTVSNLAGGSYVATASYGTSCSAVLGTYTVNNPPALVATSNITNQDGSAANGAIDLIINGGSAPYTYNWDGPGITAGNETIQDPSGLVAGAYAVTVTDVEGCQTTHALTIINENPPLSAVTTVTDACEGDGCIDITVISPTLPPFVISWSGQESGTKTTLTYEASICELTPGLYNITVTDINNISYTVPSETVVQRPPVSLTSTVEDPDQDQSNGSISLTASPGLPLTYNWIEGTTGNSPVVFGLDEGHYCVEVTNALPNGCTKIYCFDLVRQYADFNGEVDTIINLTCAGLTNGSIALQIAGGAAPYTYAWSNGATTASLTNAGQGAYSVTVTDQRDSILVFSGMNLTSASQLAISNVNELSNYNGYQVAGAGNCNGVANVVTTGANGTVTYQWSNGVTGAMNTSLCGGTYTVMATDATGCTSSWTGELTVPDAIVPSYSPASDYNGFNISCYGKCDGVARVQVNGGVAPYTIEWPNGEVDIATGSTVMAEADDLCAGTYEVTITDNNNNEHTMPITLTEPDSISITFSDIEPTNLATCNAEIIAEADNLVGNAEWMWSSQFHQGTGQRAEDLCSDELVTFIVIDENGCRATATHLSPFPIDECFKPNPIMTPNDDRVNDVLDFKCLDGLPNTLEVYDRWGRLVFQAENYGNTWDGKFGGVGEKLPTGTYYYVLNFINEAGVEIVLKGYFDMLR